MKEKQYVFVVFGEYCPEPYIQGVYGSAEKAQTAIDALSHPEQYTIVQECMY